VAEVDGGHDRLADGFRGLPRERGAVHREAVIDRDAGHRAGFEPHLAGVGDVDRYVVGSGARVRGGERQAEELAGDVGDLGVALLAKRATQGQDELDPGPRRRLGPGQRLDQQAG
jgi:hypothetical protein